MVEYHSPPGIDIADDRTTLGPRMTYQRVSSIDDNAAIYEGGGLASSTCDRRTRPQPVAKGTSSDIPLLPQSFKAPNRDTAKRVLDNVRHGPSRIKLRRRLPNWQSDWRLGLFIGCGTSGLVLIINITVLLLGAFRYGGFQNGIGTLAHGRASNISRMSTAYHVAINLASTILLTSSNYCMQILCSPTRDEVDIAHRRGRWFNLGVLSLHNLRYISRRRIFLWWILGLSSVPLHLFFNSAIFEVTIGQDYYIDFVDASDEVLLRTLNATAIRLTNIDWQQLYDTQFIPNAGNVHLVLDKVSFGFRLNSSHRWDYIVPNSTLQGSEWSIWDQSSNPPVEASVELKTDGSFEILGTNSHRSVYNISTYNQNQSSLPEIEWPKPTLVHASKTRSIMDVSYITGINKSTFWLAMAPFHIAYAFVEPITDSSSVQIGLSFMVIVIISNATKFMAILFTLLECRSSNLITTGDAIASFLERADLTTVGMCNLKKQEISSGLRDPQNVYPAPWRSRRSFIMAIVGTKELAVFSIALLFATAITIVAMTLALPKSMPPNLLFKWGTASQLQLGFANSSFDTRGVLLNAWLANTPQIILSASYFLVNRLCTSMCIALEWNSLAVSQKALRVTNPSGEQRSTRFLSLPYRWAIPLTIISGVLHWLLSQSLFLARREIRDVDGNLIPSESRCACGYSALSVLIFSLTWFTLLIVVLGLLLRKMHQMLPLAKNCSLIISAACHPLPDEVNPQLRRVQWGVVRSRYGADIGHCTFTSEEVTAPEEGTYYA